MRPRRTPHVLFALFAALCFAAITWPVYPWVDRVFADARPLGLPFAFAWHIAWVCASFLALLAFHLSQEREW